VVLETEEPLAPLLGWLATLPLAEVRVEPVGLQAVYDRFHKSA
jgi:ABC-2 type transport system ATP-binding protein